MKICKDCKHFHLRKVERYIGDEIKWVDERPDFAVCKAVDGPKSLVTGEPKGEPHPYCEVARITPCGPNASLYEAKE